MGYPKSVWRSACMDATHGRGGQRPRVSRAV